MAREPHLRDYLTRDEVTALLRAAKKSPRHAMRNHAMIFTAYRHGLRASEVTNLRVSDVDVRNATIYCRRAKGSRSSIHPMKAGRGTHARECSAAAQLLSPRVSLPLGARGENEPQRVVVQFAN